jgi:ectoine utilization protein EutC
MGIRILTEEELRKCVILDDQAIEAIEKAFVALSNGLAVTPIMGVPVVDHNGELHVKSAYIQGYDSFAVKMASGWFDNPKQGLPSGSGLMMLFSSDTGFPQAILFDNAYLTHTRTGAAGAIAAKHLARKSIERVGVVGAGRQGREQLMAVRLVRSFGEALVFDHDRTRAEAFAREMGAKLDVVLTVAEDAEALVRGCDLVVTATPSKEPIVKAEWLHAGLHLTAMGADNGRKQELFADVLANADRRVCDLKSQAFRVGEHHFALEAGYLSATDRVDELGDIVAGKIPGRTSDSEVTICDLTGVGVQDTAIAMYAYDRAVTLGLGRHIQT